MSCQFVFPRRKSAASLKLHAQCAREDGVVEFPRHSCRGLIEARGGYDERTSAPRRTRPTFMLGVVCVREEVSSGAVRPRPFHFGETMRVAPDRRHYMTSTRKPFAEFAVELAAGLRAGREDEQIAENATLKAIEVAPGDWRLQMIFDHAVEVVGDESFPTREAAVEEIVDRLVSCPGELHTEPIQ